MKKCEHVIIFGLDGIGTYIKDADTPEIDRIFADGASTYQSICVPCTSSGEGWGSIFTGTAPLVHRLCYPVYIEDPERLHPTLFSRIHDAMPDAVMGSFCEWADLNLWMFEEVPGLDKRTLPSSEEITRQAAEFLIEKKPTFMFLCYNTPDAVGHNLGFGTIPYYDGITECDGYVGKLFEAAEAAGMTKENTLFIVMGDHGGLSFAHGGVNPLERYVYFAAAGCGVEHTDLGLINIRDTAAVVLHALGIELPEFDPKGWTAQIPKGLFSDGSGADYQPVVVPQRNAPHDLPKDTAPIAFSADNGIGGLFGERAPVLALTFDGKILDNAGNYETVQCYNDGTPIESRLYDPKGIRHVKDGVRGDCILCNRDGYLSIPSFRPGCRSFSAVLWFRLEHGWYRRHAKDKVFSYSASANTSDGFYMNTDDSYISFSLRSGDEYVMFGKQEKSMREPSHTFPEDFDGGWMHLIFSVDLENRLYRLYCGFELIGTGTIPESFDRKAFDGCGELRIGYELSTSRDDALSNMCMIDDFLWFDRALDDNDIEILRRYYQ